MPAHRGQGGVEAGAIVEPVRLERDVQRLRPLLRHLHGQHAGRVLVVVEQGDPRQPRGHFAKELQPLAVLGADPRDAGQIAARPGHAGHETGLFGERGPTEHDRDRGGRVLGGEGRRGARGADHVGPKRDELARERREPALIPAGPAGLDRDVAPLHVVELAQGVTQGVQLKYARVRRRRTGR